MHPLRTEVDATLAADPRVVGWGLVGSYGRGEADRWSDLDLLVAVADETWDDAVVPDVWPRPTPSTTAAATSGSAPTR